MEGQSPARPRCLTPLWGLALALHLLSSPIQAATTIRLDHPILLDPPAACKDLIPSTDMLQVVELRRIRFVLDQTAGTYRVSTARCSDGGISDQDLVAVGAMGAPIAWSAADRLTLDGHAKLPAGFSLLLDPLTMKGQVSGGDPLPVPLVPRGETRKVGKAFQHFNIREVVTGAGRKFELDLRTVRVTAARGSTSSSWVEELEVHELLYHLDPDFPRRLPPRQPALPPPTRPRSTSRALRRRTARSATTLKSSSGGPPPSPPAPASTRAGASCRTRRPRSST